MKKVLLIIFMLVLTSCSNHSDSNQSQGYLSFTLTYQAEDDNQQPVFFSDIYKYDLGAEAPVLMATIPYEKDYPLGVYLKSKDAILYSGISDQVVGNQVWLKDLQNQQEIMLTQDFYYLAFLQPLSENNVLVGGVLKGADDIAINLYELNLESKALTPIDFNDDIDVRHISYDASSQSVLFSGYSQDDIQKRLENQETIPFQMGDNYIFEYHDDQVDELLVSKANEVKASFRRNNQLYYRNLLSNYCFDIDSQTDCDAIDVYYLDPFYDQENERLYYIDDKSLRVYDFKTQGSTVLFTDTRTNSAINNMFYIEGNK